MNPTYRLKIILNLDVNPPYMTREIVIPFLPTPEMEIMGLDTGAKDGGNYFFRLKGLNWNHHNQAFEVCITDHPIYDHIESYDLDNPEVQRVFRLLGPGWTLTNGEEFD